MSSLIVLKKQQNKTIGLMTTNLTFDQQSVEAFLCLFGTGKMDNILV